MKTRCSPYNPCVLIASLGICLFFFAISAKAQCHDKFSFQSQLSGEDTKSGKIEVAINDPQVGNYTFQLYELNESLVLVDTKLASSPEKIIFENLKPSTYFVKIEWDDSCRKVLGGFDGILVTAKGQEDE